jgi:hypothetical protein
MAQEKKRRFVMNRNQTVLDLLIGAMQKLNPKTGERQNLMAFIESCYGGRVRCYDLDRAVVSLNKLNPEEQHCLIGWTLQEKEIAIAFRNACRRIEPMASPCESLAQKRHQTI